MSLAPMIPLALVLLSGPPPAQPSACPHENAELTVNTAPQGLRGLLAAGVLQGKDGIAAKRLFLFVAQPSALPLTVRDAYAYRSHQAVAVAVQLKNPAGAAEWKVGQAMLRPVGTGAELPQPQVWQSEAAGPEMSAWVVVEFAATKQQARGTYTLVLWEAGGTRPITLEGVTFP